MLQKKNNAKKEIDAIVNVECENTRRTQLQVKFCIFYKYISRMMHFGINNDAPKICFNCS